MNWQDRITIDPAVLVGKPVIKGTRLPVEFIVDHLAGWADEEVLEKYPGITLADTFRRALVTPALRFVMKRSTR